MVIGASLRRRGDFVLLSALCCCQLLRGGESQRCKAWAQAVNDLFALYLTTAIDLSALRS